MDSSDEVSFPLPYLEDLKLLELGWHLFSGWGREPATMNFDLKGNQYLIYEWLQPIAT
jgi:hypothetical protein